MVARLERLSVVLLLLAACCAEDLLELDNECQAGSEDSCSLNALQRRGKKVIDERSREGDSCYPDVGKEYGLVWSAQGQSFFDNFTFLVTRDDGTHGAAQYVNRDVAFEESMVEAKDSHAIIRTGGRGWSYKRKSVNMHSNFVWSPKDSFIVALRFTHLPHGCGIWPAFWTKASGHDWPNGGEIDIIESANGWNNKVSFHMGDKTPCTLDAAEVNKCEAFPESNGGMNYNAFTDYTHGRQGTSPNSPRSKKLTGDYFSENPGVMVAEVTGDYVKVFFIPDAEMPADLAEDKPRPKTWDQFLISFLPFTASDKAHPGSCADMADGLKPQELVFNIGMCGDWAGGQWLKEKTCSAPKDLHYPACAPDNWNSARDCCTRFIYDVNDTYNAASYFQEMAYFNITWLKVYQDPSAGPPSQPPPPPPPPAAACSRFPECSKIGLGGNCCPTATGMMMGCCKSLGQASCDKHPKCKLAGLTGACCPTAGGARMGCCEPAPDAPAQPHVKRVVVKASANLSAAACLKHPKCAALGLDGECCPNHAKQMMGCCDLAVAPPILKAQPASNLSASCEMAPACAALNLTGLCCPTLEGIRMGCCGAQEVHQQEHIQQHDHGHEQAPYTPSGMMNVSTKPSACSRAPKCATIGLSGECCPTAAGVRMGCCDDETEHAAPTTTTVSTRPVDSDGDHTCASFPACAALGLAGACCPNAAGVRMGCCDAPAPSNMSATTSPRPAVDTDGDHACLKFPACAALGLAGTCCPNAAGVRMGCCDGTMPVPQRSQSNSSAGDADNASA